MLQELSIQVVILRAPFKIVPHGINILFQKWYCCSLQWGISVLDSVKKSLLFCTENDTPSSGPNLIFSLKTSKEKYKFPINNAHKYRKTALY